jgi:HAD superfamily hydrolase (TIGR01509 family)
MVFPRPIRAVVFDMDGLLIDTEVVFRNAFMAAIGAAGLEIPAPVYLEMIGSNRQHSYRVLRGHYGGEFDTDRIWEDATRRFREVIDLEDRLKAGVVELLDHLDELGLPEAIATSSPHDAVDHHLGPNGIAARFQAVIARGDYANSKPAPDPFLAAAKALGVAPEDCLALEDSHNGVRAAHAAGMMTIMVPDLLEPNQEMAAKTVAIAESLHEVEALVRAHRVG